ncbi:GTPase IMAP family member 8-like [Sardina pilchardus]|uniref:GTPase IMAP family member 8-like n=1 Tax=Sardina pilchardus TaxID=27697 RepID=UPI002E1006E6
MSLEQTVMDERRVVVLGANGSEKTSVISTLFGQKEYKCVRRTRNCVKTEGVVDGRRLICVDTPGWWRSYPLIDTAEFIKRKIALSVTECAPGPHAFMLVISTDGPFTEKYRRAIEEHLGLFGESVWKHTIVVFTIEGALGDGGIEQFTESGREALTWLLEKCGNVCHNFYSHCVGGLHDTTQLLGKIDDIVAKNRDRYFEFDERASQGVEKKRKTDLERGMSRQQRVHSEREIVNEHGVVHSLPELRVVLFGWLFSGKTFARNTILGLKEDIERRRTERSERKSGLVAGRQISVVDTPGWYKYFPSQYMPERVKTEIRRGLTLDSKNSHVILLAVPVDTTFHERQRMITEDNMKMFGEQIWKHTMVLFTCGDLLGETTIEEHIECEGEPLRWLVEKCGNRYHVLSWSDEEDQVVELLKKIEEMVAGNSLFCPERELEKNVSQETVEKPEAIQKQTAQYLDLEWERMDEAMKEKIKKIWNQTRHTKLQKKGSISIDVNFHDSKPSSENTSNNSGKDTSPLNLPKCFTKDHSPSNSTTAYQDQEQTTEIHPGQMERIREIFERECGRLEVGVTERFQPLL